MEENPHKAYLEPAASGQTTGAADQFQCGHDQGRKSEARQDARIAKNDVTSHGRLAISAILTMDPTSIALLNKAVA